jgi:heptosyltransferase-2
MNEYGNLIVFNKASEYAYRLGIDDDLKFFKNEKTYQEIIYEIAEIDYEQDEYIFSLKEASREKGKDFLRNHGIKDGDLCIGLNTGAGTKFETKQWPQEYYLELVELLSEKLKAKVFLMGGKKEKDLNFDLERSAKSTVYNIGSENTLLEFAGFISLMDAIVCSDTLALHLAIGLNKRVVAVFGPTCPQEVDLFGRGIKLFASESCSPCYKKECSDMKCMKEITADQVFEEIKKII